MLRIRGGDRRLLRLQWIALFSLSACGTPSTDAGFVAKQWVDSFAPFNIWAVYPPREDLHVGDLFAVMERTDPTLPADRAYKQRSIHIASLPGVSSALRDYYRSRPVFPKTMERPADGKIWPQGTDNQGIFRDTATVDRLPLVEFPGFTVGVANAATASAGVPLRFFNFLFGGTAQNQAVLSFSIPAAETYELPAATALRMLDEFCSGAEADGLCDRDAVSFFSDQVAQSLRETGIGRLYLVYQVYLARSIEYQYSASSGRAIGADLIVRLRTALAAQQALRDLQSGSTDQGSKEGQGAASAQSDGAGGTAASTKTTESPAAGKPSASATAADGDAASKQADIAARQAALQSRLRDILNQLAGAPAPSGTISVTSVSENAITLTQTFERPVAIGYRALRIEPRRRWVAARAGNHGR